jgi:oxygen-independent coproporphyrinogen-3 oxidase
MTTTVHPVTLGVRPPRGTSLESILAGALGDARAERTLGLYLSVPFCRTKCHFCDWVTEVPVQRLRFGRAERSPYVEAVCRQIAHAGPLLREAGYVPHVMYWGGGTPTRLETGELLAIWDALAASFDLSRVIQWSMETTPDCLTEETVGALAERGLNRLSVGVQSFNDDHLRAAGRGHDVAGARRAIESIKRLDFPCFNIDLISGFPHEADESWRRTLLTTLELEPHHVSVYPYRPAEGTTMAGQIAAGRYPTLDTERMIATYEMAMELLSGAGYYEYIHGYWIRREQDRDMDAVYGYNLMGDKLGIGSGADSVLAHALLVNERASYDGYLNNPTAFSLVRRFSLTDPGVLVTQLGGALMTTGGIHFRRFEALTGLSFAEFRNTPFMVRWFEDLRRLGADPIVDDEHIALPAATIHKVYIRYVTATQVLKPLWKQRDLLVES